MRLATRPSAIRALIRPLLVGTALLVGAARTPAQTPGLIYQPATTAFARSVLDPNGDGYISAAASGFSGTSDGRGAMELGMVRVPVFGAEPAGDLTAGDAGSQLDLLANAGADTGVVYLGRSTVGGTDYLVVRLRLAASSTSGRAFSVLFDLDGRLDAVGRNPGFERELVLSTAAGGGVTAYDLVPGSLTVTARGPTQPLGERHQRAVAAAGAVYYDFFIAESDLGIAAGTAVRVAAATISSGASAVTGTVADVAGVDDAVFENGTATLVRIAGETVPAGGTFAAIAAGTAFAGKVTTIPTVVGALTTASAGVLGVSAEEAGTAVRVYRNGGTLLGSTAVGANGSWSLAGVSGLATGDAITAEAEAAGKAVSGRSAATMVTPAPACYVSPPTAVAANPGARTISGTWTAQANSRTGTARITVFAQTTGSYQFTPVGEVGGPTGANSGGAWAFRTDLPDDPAFGAQIYYAVATVGGCSSDLSNGVTSGTPGTKSAAPLLLTDTLVASTGARSLDVQNADASTATLFVYVNGVLADSQPGVAPGATHSFAVTGLNEADYVWARALGGAGALLSDRSAQRIVVVDGTPTTAPTITGGLAAGTGRLVVGTSGEPAGTLIAVGRRVGATQTALGNALVSGSGTWGLGGLTLAAGDTIFALAKAANKPVSAPSADVVVASAIPGAPVITTTPIVAGTTATIEGTGGVGTVRVYVNGALLGSTTGGAWSLTGFAAEELTTGAVVTATNTDAGIESAASPAVVVQGVRSFVITDTTGAPLGGQVAGVPFAYRVTAYDGPGGTGAIVTGFAGRVVLASSSAIAAGGGLRGSFVAGTYVDTLTLLTAGADVRVSAVSRDDPALVGTTTLDTLAPNAAERLVLASSPANAVAGASLSAVVVRVEDAFGNLRTDDDSRTVTLALAANPGGDSLAGTTTRTVSAGVATFDDLRLVRAGAGYTIAARDGGPSGLVPDTSGTFDVTPGTAARLRVRAAPTAGISAAALAPALEVAVEDTLGNLVPSAATTIVIAVDSGPAGAVLGGTVSAATTAGSVSFGDLTLDLAGRYRLRASDAGPGALASALADTLRIAAGPAVALRLQQAPADTARHAIALATQPVLRLVDAAGNAVADPGVAVTAVVLEDSATAVHGAVVTDAAGVATFTDLRVDGRAGRTYTLRFNASGMSAVDAAPLTLSHGTAATVALQVATGTLVAGDTLDATVAVRDAAGNPVTDGDAGSAPVVLRRSLAGAAGTAVREDSTVLTAGTVTLPVTETSSGVLTLTARAAVGPASTEVSSADVAVPVAAARATRLTFTSPPADGRAGAPLAPALAVRVEDAYGNLASDDTATVTLAIEPATGATGATLGGGAGVAAVGGIATFPALTLTAAADGYRLRASSGDLTATTSAAFAIRAAAPDAALSSASLARSTLVVGDTTSLVVAVRDAYGNRSADPSLVLAVTPATGGGVSGVSGLVAGFPFTFRAADSTWRTAVRADAPGAPAALAVRIDGTPLTGGTPALTVLARVTATQAIASRTLTVGRAAGSFAPVTAAEGVAPYTFTLRDSAGVAPASLPTGLVLDAGSGAISGTPTAASPTTTFTVRVTDAEGYEADAPFTLAVNAALAATAAVPAIVLTQGTGVAPITPVTTVGGSAPVVRTLRDATDAAPAALPAGLTFDPVTGAITGTPTAVVPATTFTVRATEANGGAAAAAFSLTVNPTLTVGAALTSRTLTQGRNAGSFVPATAAGGTAPLIFALRDSGDAGPAALPSGLAFDAASGAISGTPSAALAATTFVVRVTDANGATASTPFTLAVNPPVTVTRAVDRIVLTQGFPSAVYVPVAGADGTAPLTYELRDSTGASAATLPPGLSFDGGSGALSGTPSTALPTTTFTVRVADANGDAATATFTLTVNPVVGATTNVAAPQLTQGRTVVPFAPVVATGGTGPLTFALLDAAATAPAALPAGLTFDAGTGVVSGTPTATLTTTVFTVRVTESNGETAAATFALTVHPAVAATSAITERSLTQGTAAVAFAPVTASGGTAPRAFQLRDASDAQPASLPAGLAFDAVSGAISGTAGAPLPPTTFTIRVTDANGAGASAPFTLTVNPPLTASAAVVSSALTQGVVAAAFAPVAATGGTAPLTFALRDEADAAPAALPTGLSLDPTSGVVSGSAAVPLPTTVFTVRVTDVNGAIGSATFVLTVQPPVAAMAAVAAPTLTQGVPAGPLVPVTATGGTAPLAFALRDGANAAAAALPAGLAFDAATGTISGTATAALAATGYTVRVTDANGDTASAAFTLTVNGAVSASTAIASTRLTLGIAAVPTRPVQGTGGTGPRTFALRDSLDVASATLPTGLTFDPATGELAGLPAAALVPARRYTVRVTDALGSAASASFELTVNPALTATLDVASRVLTVGVADTLVPVRPGGGTAPYVFALRDASDQAATLPAGLAFDATSGRITGAIAAILPPTTYRVRITDANGAVAGEAFTLEARLPVVPPSAPLALAVAVADTVVSLTWDAPADSGNASITEYRIQYAVAGGATWTDYPRAASPMRSAALADLPLGPGYRFRVRAVNAAGVGAPSAETAEVVPARPLPDLSITMTADRTTLALGDTVTVTITVINSGRGWADDVVVPGLTADPRLALLASEASRGTVDSATDRWILGRVDGGTTATLRLRFLVRIPPQGGTP